MTSLIVHTHNMLKPREIREKFQQQKGNPELSMLLEKMQEDSMVTRQQVGELMEIVSGITGQMKAMSEAMGLAMKRIEVATRVRAHDLPDGSVAREPTR